jgi:hypothetical protein
MSTQEFSQRSNQIVKQDFFRPRDLRRASFGHSFMPPPIRSSVDESLWNWNKDILEIRPSEGKGNGLFIRACENGLLIPYGGVFITLNEYSRLLNHRSPTSKRTTYCISCCFKDSSGKYIRLIYCLRSFQSRCSSARGLL